MATPILNTVNSYSVSDGVTLTFNANYGTNLVRGSIVTIMDMESNILAYHIYIPSTYADAATTHILPSKQALINESTTPIAYSSATTYNVDAVVSYENATYICIAPTTGNAPTDEAYWMLLGNAVGTFSYISEDFATDYINEKQYQYYIETFTSYDSALNLIGRSDNSNKRSAWTLPQPTVTIDNIGTDGIIDTTSYTIGVTYNTNIQTAIINTVYNPPKTVAINLYQNINGDWQLVQESGTMYNGGTMINQNEYYMNYTFTGLGNGLEYKITTTITSLLGMVAIGESNTFTVQAQTYELGAFSVENDGCNGRIVITSDIVSIDGESDVEPSGGEIDLTNSTAIWRQGFSFTNNWTTRLWGYNFKVAESVPSNDRILHLASSASDGVIDAYILQDVTDDTKIKVGLYVYPRGYNSVVEYFESDSVSIASITSSTPLYILIGFDYDNTGSYFVKATV